MVALQCVCNERSNKSAILFGKLSFPFPNEKARKHDFINITRNEIMIFPHCFWRRSKIWKLTRRSSDAIHRNWIRDSTDVRNVFKVEQRWVKTSIMSWYDQIVDKRTLYCNNYVCRRINYLNLSAKYLIILIYISLIQTHVCVRFSFLVCCSRKSEDRLGNICVLIQFGKMQ